jgi:hypothetical protein
MAPRHSHPTSPYPVTSRLHVARVATTDPDTCISVISYFHIFISFVIRVLSILTGQHDKVQTGIVSILTENSGCLSGEGAEV